MRKKLIAANWKMHKNPEQALAFVSAFVPLVATTPGTKLFYARRLY